jgi:hypothetical protein
MVPPSGHRLSEDSISDAGAAQVGCDGQSIWPGANDDNIHRIIHRHFRPENLRQPIVEMESSKASIKAARKGALKHLFRKSRKSFLEWNVPEASF